MTAFVSPQGFRTPERGLAVGSKKASGRRIPFYEIAATALFFSKERYKSLIT